MPLNIQWKNFGDINFDTKKWQNIFDTKVIIRWQIIKNMPLKY